MKRVLESRVFKGTLLLILILSLLIVLFLTLKVTGHWQALSQSYLSRFYALDGNRAKSDGTKEESKEKVKNSDSRERLKDVRFWAYQIQFQNLNNNIQKLVNSHYDLVVIDQIGSIKEDRGYNDKRDVALLKNSSNSKGGKKIVICYIDVGEAESFRWYWRQGWAVGNPEWIVSTDPDGWDECYPVKFWRRRWKDIMKQCIDRIYADGYDGIYLDWLEAYSFSRVKKAAIAEGRSPRGEITKFVRELANYARSKNPEFIVIAQNAPELGRYDQYTEVFDAIGQEAIWYDGGGDPDTGEQPGDVRQSRELTRWYLYQLEFWKRKNIPIFNIEYAQRQQNASRAYSLGAANGFTTYVTLRPLAKLTKTPPPGY